MAKTVDDYIGQSDLWPDEMTALRPILLDCGLTEEIKWAKPCYADADGNNIGIMQEMKDHLCFMFFKGSLLTDPAELLHFPGPNSRVGKRFQFTSVDDITSLADTITDYVAEAIEIEEQGLEVPEAPPPEWCEELTNRLEANPDFREAFEGLTPGRQREYNLHFSDAKQAKTREGRIDKYTDKILAGKGFRDRD